MKVETKFNVGDIVYTVSGEIQVHRIDEINIIVAEEAKYLVRYNLAKCTDRFQTKSRANTYVVERNLFSTKEEAAQFWLEKQNMSIGVQNVVD